METRLGMRTKRRARGMARAGALLALLIGLGLTAAAAPLKTYDEVVAALPHADAAGEVLDASGKPVAGAEVFLYYEAGFSGYRDRLAGRVATDDKGRFRFEKAVVWEPPTVPERGGGVAKYDVIARHPKTGMGYAVFTKNDAADQLQITLEPTKPFTLTVKDPAGKPLEGARVHLNTLPKMPKSSSAQAAYNSVRLRLNIGLVSGQTGGDGKVTLESLPGSVFTAVKDGYTKNFSGREFKIYPSVPVSGRVLDADKKPIGGIPVWFMYSGKSTSYYEYAVTDAQGRFAFPYAPGPGYSLTSGGVSPESVEKGRVTLNAVDNRAGASEATLSDAFEVKAGEKSVTRDLAMKPGVRLAGQVVDAATGKPIPRMGLYASAPDGSNSLRSIRTDEEGRFSLSYPRGAQARIYLNNTRTGDYILEEEQSGRQIYATRLERDTTGVVLKARVWQVKTLHGSVLAADGKPAPGASVYMHAYAPPVKSGRDGRFTLKVAPSERDFDLLAIDAAKQSGAVVHCKAGADVATLRLEPLRDYAGKALTPAGLAADHLSFRLYPMLNESLISDAAQSTTTTAEGAFSAKGLLPKATYQAQWSSSNEENRDYDYGSATIELAALKPGEPVVFEARKFVNALMGTVVDAQDKPLAGAFIEVQNRDMMPQSVGYDKRFTTDKAGRFTIDRLADGKVQLQVSHSSHRLRSLVADSDSIDCVVKLSDRTTTQSVARFLVVDEKNQPLSGTLVKIFTRFGSGSESGGMPAPSATLKTDAAGVAEHRMFSGSGPIGLLGRMLAPQAIGRGGVYCCDLPGYDFSFGRINEQGDSEILVRLVKSGRHYSGRVVDEQQQPVAGAQVDLVGWGAREGRTTYYFNGTDRGIGIIARTDKDGRFEFPRITPDCNLSLTLRAEGYAKTNQRPSRGEARAKDLVLTRPGIIEGKVVNRETGKPVGVGRVYVYSQGAGGSEQKAVGADGSFRFEGLAAGQYQPQYWSAGSGQGPAYMMDVQPVVTVAPGRPAQVTLEVVEAVTVKGKLIDPKTGKAPQGSYFIRVSRQDGSERGSTLYSGRPDGSWSCQLPPGTYQISAVPRENMGDDTAAGKTFKIEKGKSYDNLVIEVTPAAKK